MGLGLVPIRLDPDGNGEVVWCDRLDPARALIRNVPTLESGFREGDIVLHDGEPKGKRELNGKFVSVFNALERIAEESGVVIEDWTDSMQILCKECSEGTPHTEHTHEERPWDPQHRIGLSALSREQASSVLIEWASSAPSREIL